MLKQVEHQFWCGKDIVEYNFKTDMQKKIVTGKLHYRISSHIR